VVYLSEMNKRRAGLDFVCGELIGWLWFAIGGSDVAREREKK